MGDGLAPAVTVRQMTQPTASSLSGPLSPTVWVGPEPLRRHYVATVRPADAATVDADEGVGAALAAAGGGLFASGVIHVRRLDVLNSDELCQVVDATSAGGQTLLGEADTFRKAQIDALSSYAEVVPLTHGRGRAAEKTWRQLGQLLGLELDRQTCSTLASRAAHELARGVGSLEALAAAGLRQPTEAQVGLLLGSAGEGGLPWILYDQLARGQADLAAQTMQQLEAIPTIGFLTKRAAAAALLVEQPQADAEALAAVLGSVSPSARSSAAALAKRAGRPGCRLLLQQLARADELAKRSQPEAALALACGALRRQLGS